jgi:hypothetical protein
MSSEMRRTAFAFAGFGGSFFATPEKERYFWKNESIDHLLPLHEERTIVAAGVWRGESPFFYLHKP